MCLPILVVEDDPNLRLGCQQALQLAGLTVLLADSAEAALSEFAHTPLGALITDVRLPGADGMQLLRTVLRRDPGLPVVVITGHGDITLAVEAMRSGAYDFITKPFAPEHLAEVARRALDKRELSQKVAQWRDPQAAQGSLERRLVGDSPAMQRVRQRVRDVADKAVDVLIHGETGTGKEMVARCLHELGGRARGHFVALNCGGLPDTLLDSELFGHEPGAFTGAARRRVGKIEHASGGTLFLDELESMPMAVQIKLLRVLQERVIERLGANQSIAVDTRVVAATKADLVALSAKDQFRSDLYYRLNVVTIDLPPLRERREDIPLLLACFMSEAAARLDLPVPELEPAQLQALMAHDWPGNVRELRNKADCLVLGLAQDEGAVAISGGPKGASLAAAVEAFERQLIAGALAREGGNLSRTAEQLRVAKTTLHDKIRRLGLQAVS
ncbi:sigma-54-dependent transcriptional regulator [Denitromonas iodatirespirans]|uniref:Sigma-54-dependent Fis family transcriptional regulator n=1 Tax=Denitromonas iodatirespirans TaxID=2795389 RepID=A0A944H9Y1_DENI1|nr:sigma-54 dependent transcriptional regulator [Denitromonas iodatirespirans]MBT0962920.1 sigma-54-dependent Fis family transcriptional regulator [Denitromonas iodatirespirans]